MYRHVVITALLIASAAGAARAQVLLPPSDPLSGPRVGITVVTGSSADRLDEMGLSPVVVQFGWQFERELFRTASGLSGVTEWIPLAGGLEQGTVLPSLSWLVGLRGGSGAEFAVGPNLSLAGIGMAIAGGATVPIADLAVPVNLALVSGHGGPRFSVLSGFILRR